MGDKIVEKYTASEIGTVCIVERMEDNSPVKYFAQVGGDKRGDKAYGVSGCLDETRELAKSELIVEIENELITTAAKQSRLAKVLEQYHNKEWFNTEEGKTLEEKE